MDSDILREYLVKVGIDIPMEEIQKFNAHMEMFDKGVFGLVKRLNNLLSGWKAVAIAYAGAAKKIADFTFNVAKADMETQKWAKHMYLTNDSAKVLSRTLDAMGLQFGDLQDVALNPELYKQYKELVRLGKELTGGKDIEQALRKVREVGFEFTKLRMILTYVGERVAYYVSKILDSPAGKSLVNGLKNLNNFLTNNMDSVARKIAGVLNLIMRTFLRISQLIRGWIELFRRAYDWLESRIKGLGNTIIALISVVGAALLLSPMGKFLLLFQAAMLLIDDYMTYQEGGEYAIPWEKLEKIWDEISSKVEKLFDLMVEFIKTIEKMGEKIGELIANLVDFINRFFPQTEEDWFHNMVKKKVEEGFEPHPIIFDSPEQYNRYLEYEKENENSATKVYGKEKPIVNLTFNGSNFTREDIERSVRGNNLAEVRFNQGSIV